MKNLKRILSTFLAVLLAFCVAIPTAHAAPDNSTGIDTISGERGIFEVDYGPPWYGLYPLTVPFWVTTDSSGSVAYCLESDQDQPWGDGYGVSQALFDETVSKGIRAILLHGMPNDCGGLTEREARYATQTAIWTWMLEAGGVGYPFYAQDSVFPAAGRQAVYDFYLALLEHARAGDDHINGGVSTSVATLTDDGSGHLAGTATVTISAYQGYRIDQGKLPPSVTTTGGTYLDGDTITITAPMSYLGRTVTMADAIVLLDTRSTANIFWYEPDGGNIQKMVVFNYELQDVFTGSLTFTSEITTGTLRICKSVTDGSSPAGFRFELRDIDGALIGTYTMDASGEIDIPGLAAGPYSVEEIDIPPGYTLEGDNPQTLNLNPDITTLVEFVNVRRLGRIVVEKQGEVFIGADKTGEGYTPVYDLRGLPGATFEIIDSDGTVADTITTDEEGRAESKPLPLGRYELVETAAPANFVLDPQRRTVVLDFDGQVEEIVTKQITVPNERYRAEIRILKLWEVPVNAPEDFVPWQDITFGLYAREDILAADGSVAIPAGTLIETIRIDQDGNGAARDDLPFGAYYIQELTTAEGYALDEQKYDILFAAAGEAVTVISISAENKIECGSLKIIKTFEGKTTPIAGVPFTIVGQTVFGEIRVDAKTDKDGVILLESLPVGTYTVTELASELTKGYVLSEVQTVTVTEGKTAEVTINNKLQRGSLRVVKTFEGRTTPVEGVPFMIVGQTVTGEIHREAKTDKDGVILLENLPVGVYTVTEMRSNLTAGYVLSPAQTVTIEAGKIAEVKIVNKLQRGNLRIVKTFEGRKEPLEGVPFLVVGKTVNGEVKFEVKTDKDGVIVLKDLPVGTYTVTEQKSDLTKGYVLAPAQTVVITAGNETILKIINQLAKGEIRVLKIDKETGKPLEGAMFGLFRDGKLIAEAKSGKDGYAIFRDVAFGEYEIRELSAPVGYNRSEDVLKAVVGKDGSVVLFEVTNERIPGEPVEPEKPELPVSPPSAPLPKTGDSNTIVVIALVVLLLAGGVVLWLRKRGKDEEPTEGPAESEELS